jgi:glycosyltransferase involved in cell wall biosynthesis
VVDDCSPGDATRRVVQQYTDTRIRYIRREENGGVAAARNTGIAAARADYVAFIDDDDQWDPTKLEKQMAVFSRSDTPLGAVGCGRIDHFPKTDEVVIPTFRGDIFADLLARRGRGYSGPLIMIRRFDDEPLPLFDQSFPALEDLEFALRIAARHPMDFVPEALVHVFQDDERYHVGNPENFIRGYRMLEGRFASQLSGSPDILCYYRYCTGRELSKLGRSKEARRDFRDGIRLSPRSGLMYLWYASTYFGTLGFRIARRFFSVPPPQRLA